MKFKIVILFKSERRVFNDLSVFICIRYKNDLMSEIVLYWVGVFVSSALWERISNRKTVMPSLL